VGLRNLLAVVTVITLSSWASAFVTVNSVVETNPPATSCTQTFVTASGQLGTASYTHVGNTVSVVGFNITITIDYTSPMIVLPAITPFTQSIDLGMLPAGTYNVTTIGQLDGMVSSTYPSTLTVINCCGAIPSFTSSETTVCVGETINFTNTSSGSTSQFWKENGSVVSTSVDHSLVASSSGTLTVELVVTEGTCSDSIQQVITVLDPPVINSVTPNGFDYCEGSQVVISSSSNGSVGYYWYHGTNPIPGGSTLLTTATGSGHQTYSLIITNGACTDSSGAAINVLPSPTIDTIYVTPGVCIGGQVDLFASTTGATTTTWFEEGMQISSSNSYSTTPSQTGSLTYKFVVSDGTCADSIEQMIDVYGLPAVDLGPDTNSCDGSIVLDAGAGFNSYEWQDMTTNQTIVADSGTYIVTVTDVNGCMNSDTVEVTTCASLMELNDFEIFLGPNPVQDIVLISIEDTFNDLDLEVINSIGQQVHKQSYDANDKIELNVSDFDSGIYYIILRTGDSRASTKLIKL
jgi:hypothetical protein